MATQVASKVCKTTVQLKIEAEMNESGSNKDKFYSIKSSI
jgi:hypothetical protein